MKCLLSLTVAIIIALMCCITGNYRNPNLTEQKQEFLDINWPIGKLLINKNEKNCDTTDLGPYGLIYYCFSQPLINLFFVNYTAGPCGLLYNYNLIGKNKIKLVCVSEFLGYFNGGTYNGLLIVGCHEFPENSGIPDNNYKIINRQGRMIKTIGLINKIWTNC